VLSQLLNELSKNELKVARLSPKRLRVKSYYCIQKENQGA
jgi:hypothetical protein